LNFFEKSVFGVFQAKHRSESGISLIVSLFYSVFKGLCFDKKHVLILTDWWFCFKDYKKNSCCI